MLTYNDLHVYELPQLISVGSAGNKLTCFEHVEKIGFRVGRLKTCINPCHANDILSEIALVNCTCLVLI